MRLPSLGILALLAVLAFLTVYPMAMLLYGSLHSTPPGEPGVFNLAGYASLLTGETAAVLLNTIVISFLHTALSLPLALFLAWIVARTDTPGRRALEIAITLPFFIPPVLTALAWGMLANPQVGSLNLLWKGITGGTTPLINIYSYGGVVWHMMQYSTPFLFLLTVDALRAIDPALEESSRMCGAGRWTTLRRITLKLLLPVTTSVAILSFIRGLEAFDSAIFFGTPAGIEVVTTKIYNSINHLATPDYQYATSLSFAIMLLMVAVVWGRWRLLRGRSFTTVTGKGYAPQPMRLRRWRWAAFAFVVLYLVVSLGLPAGQLLLGSFFKFFGFYSRDMLTLDNYRAVLDDQLFWRAFRNTLLLAVLGASATMVLGGLVAYVVVRTRARLRFALDTLAWLPWMMPGMVLGLGFLWAFALLPGVPIYGTIWALLLAYIALGSPLAVRVMSGAFAQLAVDLEECSRVHGASWMQTFRRILIALAWPSFAVAWMLTFFMVLRELSASILLYSVNSEVLSVVILQLWTGGKAEEVSVIGLIMLALVLLFRFVQLRLLGPRLSSL
jgi:iron(III) transport system permease protein